MATEDEDYAAFNDDEDDLEYSDDTDMEDFDDDDHNNDDVIQPPPPLPPPPPPPPPPPAPITSTFLRPPNPIPIPSSIIDQSFSDQNGAIQITSISSAAAAGGGGVEQTRRLFQRLWTDDDEIKILKGFLEFTSLRGTTFASHQYDTGPFYEQIKNELQLDFNKNQLIEKLRRLKKKYRNTANRMASHGSRFSFKTPHEMETYKIAKKIWSASIVKSRESDEDDVLNISYSNNNVNSNSNATTRSSRSRRRGRKRSLETPMLLSLPAPPPPPPPPPQPPVSENVVKVEVLTSPMTNPTQLPTLMIQEASNSNCNNTTTPSIPSVIAETVKSCLSPIFKELLNSTLNSAVGGSVNIGGLGIKLPPLFNFGGELGELALDERWKKQRILELEVYLKRVELVQEQIKATLDELKGSQTEPASES